MKTIKTIASAFPADFVGYSDIHSTAQLGDVVDMFGRGVIGENGAVLTGIGGSHVQLGQGARFYFGRKGDTVYIVSKNSIDTSTIKANLAVILSAIFNKYRLSCNGLTFQV